MKTADTRPKPGIVVRRPANPREDSMTGTSGTARFAISTVLAVATAGFCASPSFAQGGVPKYEVDISWPKLMPTRWITGGLGGHCVDANDHVLILNRQDVMDGELNAGKLAPAMIE